MTNSFKLLFYYLHNRIIIIIITSEYYVADFGYLDPMGFVPLY